MPRKKSAPKKATKRAPARATKKVTKPSVASRSRYHHERDQFFVEHPNAKMLLAVFIIATAFFVGMYYRNTMMKQYVNQEYVNMQLPPVYTE